MILVITIHTNLYQFMHGTSLIKKGDYLLYDLFNNIIAEEIARVAVPLFFVISGYLFFYNTDLNLKSYKTKLIKRFHSLLIPYILWNIFVGIFQYISQKYLNEITSGGKSFILDYKWYEWIKIFWNFTDGTPICNQFWFIRDLMVIVIISPLIYFFIKKTKIYGLLLIFILYLTNSLPKFSFYTVEPYYFFLGAYFSINKIDIVDFSTQYFKNKIWLYSVLLLLSVLISYQYIPLNNNYFHKLTVLIGIFLSFSIIRNLLANGTIITRNKLADSTFFLYAYHMLPTSLLCKLWIKYLQPNTSFELILSFILIDSIIVIIGYYLYNILRNMMPNFMAIDDILPSDKSNINSLIFNNIYNYQIYFHNNPKYEKEIINCSSML